MKRWIFCVAVIGSGVFAVAWAHAEEPSSAIQVSSGSRFLLPSKWTMERSSAAMSITAPEGDVTLFFLELPRREHFEDTVAEAWKFVRPDFGYKPLQTASPPSSKGWDETHSVVYDVPARESRSIVALVRILGGRAYVNLIDGSDAGMSRRGAQVNEAVGSWKPFSLEEPTLAGRKMRPWDDDVSAKMEAFILSAMKDLQVPGASIAVAQNGRVVYSRGFGMRGLGSSDPVTPKTLFMIGSMTKSLTSYMMAKLVETGKVSWTTPVSRLLNGFALGDPETTRRLELQHTVCACTGMPRRDMEMLFKFSGISPEERIAQMRTMIPTTGFGETFQYSNLLVAAGGYAAARDYVPEGSLQHAYQKSMQELVFDPLGMKDTVLTQEDASSREFAWPHSQDLDGRTRESSLHAERFVDNVAPAGAAWSNVEDLARYMAIELGNGRTPDGKQIIDERDLLRRRDKSVAFAEKGYYGLGLMVNEDQGLQFVGHGGNTTGFTSMLDFFPKENLGIVGLSNLAGSNQFLAAIKQRMLELLFDAKPKAEQMVRFAVDLQRDGVRKLHEKVSTDTVKTAWISELAGTYENSDLGSAVISTAAGGGFRVQFDEWGSRLGAETQGNGDRLIATTDAPWSGLELLVRKNGQELLLDADQVKYVFRRK